MQSKKKNSSELRSFLSSRLIARRLAIFLIVSTIFQFSDIGNIFFSEIGLTDLAGQFANQNAYAAVTLTQEHYRWYANANQTLPTSSLAALDTPTNNIATGTVVRLRVNVGATVTALTSTNASFNLQYSTSTSGGWKDVGAAGSDAIWTGYDNATPVNGTSASSSLLASSTAVESYQEYNNAKPNPTAIASGGWGEWDWVLLNNRAATGTTYYFRMIKASSTLGSWSKTTPMLNMRIQDVPAIYSQSNIYVQGGVSSGVNTSSVIFTSISATGSIGTWSQTAALPQVRPLASGVEYNGYLYLTGGQDTNFGIVTSSVIFAPISATGTVGAWSYTASMPGNVKAHAVVASNGYIYSMGGNSSYSGSAPTSSVFFAPIGATGTLGAWQATKILPDTFTQHAAVANDGYIYVIGGSVSSGATTATILYAHPNATGSISNWTSTTSMPNGVINNAAVINNGFLYNLGGQTIPSNLTTSTVFYAPINATGSVGVWQQTTKVPYALYSESAVANNGYIYMMGGTSVASGTDTSTVLFASFAVSSTLDVYTRYPSITTQGVPGTPGTPTYTNISTSTLTVNWTAATSTTFYEIERSTDGNSFGQIATTSALTYGDTGLSGSTNYWYRLRGNNTAFGDGSYSASSSVTTTAAPISVSSIANNTEGFTNAGKSGDSITLTGVSFGAPTAGNRANCAGASGTGCIKLVAGGNDTVADQDISAWSGSSITFTISSTLASIGGAGALQVLASSTGSNTSTFFIYPHVTSMATCTNCNGNAGREYNATDTDGIIKLSGDHFGMTTGTILFSGNFNNASATMHNVSEGACLSAPGWQASTSTSATIALIQQATTSIAANASSSLSVTLSASPTAGDALVASIGADGDPARNPTAVSGGGVTWVKAAHKGDTAKSHDIWYGLASSGAGTKITVTFGATAGDQAISVSEFSNVASASALDASSTNTTGAGTNANVSTTNMTTVNADDLLFAGFADDNAIGTNAGPTNSFTALSTATVAASTRTATAYRVVSAAGTYSTAWTLTGADGWAANIIALKASSSGGSSMVPTGNTACVEVPQSIGNKIYTGSVSLVRIADSSGTVNAWANGTALPQAEQYLSTPVYNGYLYETGGISAAATATVRFALINATGSIGNWTSTTALPNSIYDHAAVAYNGYMYVVGGSSALATPTSTVYYAPINSTGSIGAWIKTTSLPAVRYIHTSVAYNGYIYTIGGSDGTTTSTVFFAPINSDGSVGAWASTTKVPGSGIMYHSSFVNNGYVYAMGGFDSLATILTTVNYAPISATGSIGAWATTTAMPVGNYQFGAGVYNGYVYTAGGLNGAATSAVLYAPINATGSIGAWSATVALPTAIYSQSSAINNGFMYILGGSGVTSTVSYTSLNSNADSIGFRVLPRILSNTPATGTVGTVVDIVGNHFCEDTVNGCPTATSSMALSSNNVKFGNASSAATDFLAQTGGAGACNGSGSPWTDAEICVKVPVAASAGSASTTITSNTSYASNVMPFTIISGASTIPGIPANLNQYLADAVTAISVGSSTTSTTEVFKGNLSASTTINMQLQVEVTSTANSFGCSGTGVCAFAVSSTVYNATTSVTGASITLTNFGSTGDAGTSYHWQARAWNTSTSEASAWTSFGGNAESSADFTVDTSAPTITNVATSSVSTSTATIVWDTSGEAATSRVQYATNSPAWIQGNRAGGIPGSVIFQGPNKAGDLIVVGMSDTGSAPLSAPTDSAGNSYVECGPGYVLFNSSGNGIQCFYAVNIKGYTASNTVSQATAVGIHIAEISGVATSSPVDVYHSAANQITGSGTTDVEQSGFATTTTAEFIYGFSTAITGPTTAGTGFASPLGAQNGFAEYKISNASGSLQATMSDPTASDPYAAMIIAFKPAAGATFAASCTTDCTSLADVTPPGTNSHAVNLTGLASSTTYYYLVRSQDAMGNEATSGIRNFYTAGSASLPVTGQVTSAVFDTGATNGATYNSILWQGTAGTGKVQFQLATSNSSSGPWNYYGSSDSGVTCDSSHWYSTTGPNAPVETFCAPQYHTNQRFFRYNIRICSNNDCSTAGATSPTVSNVVVNWSP